MKWKKIISGTLAAVLVLSSVITAVPIEAIAADNLVTAEISGVGQQPPSEILVSEDTSLKGWGNEPTTSHGDQWVLTMGNERCKDNPNTSGAFAEQELKATSNVDSKITLLKFSIPESLKNNKDSIKSAKLSLALAGFRSSGGMFGAQGDTDKLRVANVSPLEWTEATATRNSVRDWFYQQNNNAIPEFTPYKESAEYMLENGVNDIGPYTNGTKNTAVSGEIVETDITDLLADALTENTSEITLAVNESSKREHYFVSKEGVENLDNATENMMPKIVLTYNVARGKTVTASSTFTDPGLAVDGNDSAHTGSNSNDAWQSAELIDGNGAELSGVEQQWLTIDLEANKTIFTSMELKFHAKAWATDYVIETSDTGDEGSWGTVVEVKRPESDEASHPHKLHTILSEIADNGTGDNVTNVKTDTLKRYVRFRFNKMNPYAKSLRRITIAEIEICGLQSNFAPVENVAVTPETLAFDESEINGTPKSLTASVQPETANPAVEWESSNPAVATVSTRGAVTAKGLGNAVITAKSVEDPTKNDTVQVTVTRSNIARNATATASSIEKQDHPANKMNNGAMGDKWASAVWGDSSLDVNSHKAQDWIMPEDGSPVWAQLAWSEIQTIQRFNIHWECGNAVRYYIEASQDGTAWTKVYVKDKAQGYSNQDKDETIVLSAPIQAKYLKINVTKMLASVPLTPGGSGSTSAWSAVAIWEWEVYKTAEGYPAFTTIPDNQEARVGEELSFQLAAENGAALSVVTDLTALTGAGFDAQTGAFTWTPPTEASGKTFDVTFAATKDEKTTYKTISIQVSAPSVITVTFHKNDGSSESFTQTADSAGHVTAPAVPTREGYTFDGWYTAAENGDKIDFSAYTVESDVDLYAHWILKQYTVTFHADGGALSGDSSQEVAHGGKATKPSNPTREGYRFIHWYLSTDTGEAEYNFDTAVTEDITLKAKWIKRWNVTFHVNQTGVSVSDKTLDEGENVTLPTPSKSGVTFAGWYEAEALTGTQCTEITAIGKDWDLYAKWTATVTFKKNDGTDATVDTQAITCGGKASAPAAPSRDHYTFGGWYQTEDCAGNAFSFETEVISAHTVLYAKWTPEQHTVTFQAGEGAVCDTPSVEVNYNETIKNLPVPTKANFVFVGWFTDESYTTPFTTSTHITANMTVYAKWEDASNTWTVTFMNGTTQLAVQHIVKGEKIASPPDPTGEHDQLVGWYREASFTTLFNISTETVTEDLTLYAKLEPKKYKVTFNWNDKETDPTISEKEFTYNTLAEEPSDVIKTGYTLTGWYKLPSCSEESKFDFATEKVIKSITLYAKWELNEYKVTLHRNYTAEDTEILEIQVKHDSNVVIPADAAITVRDGYTLTGWHKDQACTDANAFDLNAEKVTSALDLYAKWTKNQTPVEKTELTAPRIAYVEPEVDSFANPAAVLAKDENSVHHDEIRDWSRNPAELVSKRAESGKDYTGANAPYIKFVDGRWALNDSLMASGNDGANAKFNVSTEDDGPFVMSFKLYMNEFQTDYNIDLALVNKGDYQYASNVINNTYGSGLNLYSNPTGGSTGADWKTAYHKINPYPVEEWRDVIAVFDGNGKTRLYVGGHVVTEPAGDEDKVNDKIAGGLSKRSEKFAIGCMEGKNERYFTYENGYLADVKLYSGADMTAAQKTGIDLDQLDTEYGEEHGYAYLTNLLDSLTPMANFTGMPYDVKTVWSADGANLSAGDKFEADTAYTATTTFVAHEGFIFPDTQSFKNTVKENISTGSDAAGIVKNVEVSSDKMQMTVTVTYPVKSDVPVTGVKLNKKTISLTAKGEQETLTATVEPEGADQSVTWSSSNEEVATVENGTVTAVGHGTATITATSAADPTKTETATVTVTITGGGENPVPVTGVKLDKKTISLTAKGEQETLTATVEPEGADQSVTWSSSNEEVATVENGTVTAVGHGTATITATSAADPTKTETATVTVTITGTGTDTTIPVEDITLDKEEILFKAIGEQEVLIPQITPRNATNREITWKSSDTGVAVVKGGRVTAVGEGTAEITVQSLDNKDAKKTVTVKVELEVPPVVEKVTLSLNANGGSVSKTSVEFTKGETVKETDVPTPARTGYHFTGWYQGQEKYRFGEPLTQDVTLTAKWSAKQYTAKFVANGGSPAPADQTIYYDGYVPVPKAMQKTGYKFNNWYSDPNFKNVFSFKTEKVKKDVILYAKWDKLEEEQSDPLAGIKEDSQNGITYTFDNIAQRTVVISKADSKKVKKVKIPKTVKINGVECKVVGIKKGAFKNCKSLKNVTIGSNVKYIEANAFQNCRKLKNVKIEGKALKTIKKGAFKGTPKGIKVTAKGYSKKQKRNLLKKLKNSGMKSPKIK